MKCKKLALRVLSTAAVLSIVSSIAAPAFADVYDLTKGDISVGFKNNTQTVTQVDNAGQYVSDEKGEINNREDDDVVITTKDDKTNKVKTTDNTVTIETGVRGDTKVTLEDVDIDVSDSDKAAITVKVGPNATAKIELKGDNTVASGNGHAGLEKADSGNLTIETKGSLTATGGNGGAGIGGGSASGNGSTSNIEISGGTIIANGSGGGAGIGGGKATGENFSGRGDNITISNGAEVTATGSAGGAGIGGGDGSSGGTNSGMSSNITIKDDNTTVRAIGGEDGGAGIGGGNKAYGDIITISDNSSVTASGNGGGAGIGGGNDSVGRRVTINGGTVIATGSAGGAGIGGGSNGTGNSITINGGNVTATGSDNAAGIGGGNGWQGAIIKITGGIVNAIGGANGAGIGGGNGGRGNTITISGGTITATGGSAGAGIGGGNGAVAKIVKIIGNETTIDATGSGGGAGIGGGKNAAGQEIDKEGNVRGMEILGGKINAKSDTGEGIGSGEGGGESDTTMKAAVTATNWNFGENNEPTGMKAIYYNADGTSVTKLFTLSAPEEIEAATCTATGKGIYTVEYVDHEGVTHTDTLEGVIPALGHNFGEWVPDGAGHKTRTCTRENCDASEDAATETDSTAAETASYAPLRVEGAPAYEQTVKDGRVLIAVPAQSASLTGNLASLKEFKAKGANVLVFRTQLCESTVSIDTLLAQGAETTTFTLTHTEGAASLTVGGADHTDLLNK